MNHPAYVVMGVSGSGKSTIGAAFAERIGAVFLDADDLHPPANRERMANGEPLTDEMRWPWLGACGEAVRDARVNAPVVLACSALRIRYRDRLRQFVPDLKLIYPAADRAVIASRMMQRADHFMPVSLLDSQIAILQIPTEHEKAIFVDALGMVSEIVDDIVAQLE